MMSKRLILVGGGGFGREVIAWVSDLQMAGRSQNITSFLDDDPSVLDGFGYGLEYLGPIFDYKPSTDDLLVMGIGTPSIKRKISIHFSDFPNLFLTVIHPSAVVARTAHIGYGAVICPFSLVSADVTISEFVTLNVMSSVGHDSTIGAYSTLSGHVDVTGQVKVGDEVFFGTSAATIPRIKIGSRAKIGAGAMVMRNVRDNAVMYTFPARRL